MHVQELSNIHEVYAKMKTAVGASSEQAVSSIDLIRKDLTLDLHGTVMDFHKWQQKEVGHVLEDVWMFAFAHLSRRLLLFWWGAVSWQKVAVDRREDDDDGGEGTSSQQEVSATVTLLLPSVYYLFYFVVYFCLWAAKWRSG